MFSNQIRTKASEFHSKIRREKLEAIFQQKRSKQQQKIMEFMKKQSEIKEQLSKKFIDEKHTISEQHSTDEVIELWKRVRQNVISRQVFSQKSEQSRQQFQQMMTVLCNMVSLTVKQLSDYNEFQKHKIMNVIKGYKEMDSQMKGKKLQEMLMGRLKTLWEVFEVSEKIIGSLLQKVEETQQMNQLNLDWLYYLEWCNIMVELTYLKLPYYQVLFNSLIEEYKQLSFYSQIVNFTTRIKQNSLTIVYPACVRLINFVTGLDKKKKQMENGNKGVQGQNKGEQSRGELERVEFVLGLYYIVGNILSDYQPSSVERHMQSLHQDTVLFKMLSNPEQLHNLLFGVWNFSQLLITLQTLRLQQYQKVFTFSYEGNQQSYVLITATIYRDYINLVEIQIWFWRLLLIGGWLQKGYGGCFQHQNRLKWEQMVQQMFGIIMNVSVNIVKDTVELIEKMKIESEQYIKKAAQYISELILVYDLSIRQIHSHNPFYIISHHSFFSFSLSHLSIIFPPETTSFSSFSLPKFIKKFTSYIINGQFLKRNVDLNLLNEIWTDLINLYETILMLGMLDVNDCEQLVEFIVVCAKGEIICSTALTLPMLVIRAGNNSHQTKSLQHNINQSLNIQIIHTFLSHLAPFIYISFVESLQMIVPIFIYNSDKMIEEDEEKFKKTGKYNSEYMKRIYLQGKSIVLKYFVENLSMKKQEDFYSGFIEMLEQCFLYYQKGVTQQFQAQITQKSNLNNQFSNINFKSDHQSLPPCLTTSFLVKFMYFIVEQVSKFDQNSPIHLQTLRFLRLVVSSFTSLDEEMETQLKNMIEYNAYGIKEYLEGMTLWESQQVNEEVVTLFQLLEIQ